jgi:alpha-1,6-mannosyltransferase
VRRVDALPGEVLQTSAPFFGALLGVCGGAALLVHLASARLPDRLRHPPLADAALVILCGLTWAAYCFLLLGPYPLLPHYARPELQDQVKLSGATPRAVATFSGTFLLLFLMYAAAVRLCREAVGARGRVAVFAAPALAAVLLAFTYPITAGDVYEYAMSGRLLAHYGRNPLLVPPSEFPSDPFYRKTGWERSPSPYGPLWALVAGGVGRVSGDSLLASLLGFKLLAVLALLCTAGLVYRGVGRTRPEARLAAFCLVAWNPLLLLEAGANAHNDFLMMLLVVLALDLLARGRPALAFPALVGSILVKFVPALLLPVFGAHLVRRAHSAGPTRSAFAARVAASVLLGILLAAAIAAAISSPFGGPGASFRKVLDRLDLFTSSPGAVILESLSARGVPEEEAARTAGLACYLAFAALVTPVLLRVKGTPDGLMSASFQVMFLYLLLATLWFQPWYLAWLVPLAGLSPDSRQRRRALVFSFAAVQLHLVTGFGARMGWLGDDPVALTAAAVAVAFGPPVALWIRDAVVGRRVGRRGRPVGEISLGFPTGDRPVDGSAAGRAS